MQHEADTLNRGIQFVALLPRQISGATQLGHSAAAAYAAQQGISEQAFLAATWALRWPDRYGLDASCSVSWRERSEE